jgi:methylmalonyl-CoA mutase cobalamin-binding domain/chain
LGGGKHLPAWATPGAPGSGPEGCNGAVPRPGFPLPLEGLVAFQIGFVAKEEARRFPRSYERFKVRSFGCVLFFREVRGMADEDEIVLSELDDDELAQQMMDDLYDGLKEEIEEGTNIFLERGWAPYDVLTKVLVEGMRIVGIDFRDGILFVPEVLLAANAMKGGMTILRPLLAETGAKQVGKMVVGTVKGDIHDIGKNLVGMMMEGAGFEVIDLGINNPVEKYLEALEQHKPEILGMSALLTTTMPYMKVVIDTLKEKGIREDYIVLVGGAPLNEQFAEAIGADAYCRDAAVAVETAKDLVARRDNLRAGVA